jgi:hypothetical protein
MILASLILYAGIAFGDFGTQLGVQLGIGPFAGGLLMSIIFMCIFLFPVLFLCRENPVLPALMVGFATMSFCVAIGWLSYWVLLMMALLVALLFSGTVRDWISGKGGG